MNKEPALLSKMQTELLRLMVPCSLKTRCLTDTSIQIYLETYWMSYTSHRDFGPMEGIGALHGIMK